jgi:hypothetical protein
VVKASLNHNSVPYTGFKAHAAHTFPCLGLTYDSLLACHLFELRKDTAVFTICFQ